MKGKQENSHQETLNFILEGTKRGEARPKVSRREDSHDESRYNEIQSRNTIKEISKTEILKILTIYRASLMSEMRK